MGLAELRADDCREAFSNHVSICQADLGLAELVMHATAGRQASVSICQADLGLAEPAKTYLNIVNSIGFNLPGRFGFGRTCLQFVNSGRNWQMFQSARQIWVWPNS